MNYTVGNVIIQIKNAVLARRRKVTLPYAKITKNLVALLVKEGFLKKVTEEVVNNKKTLVVEIAQNKRTPVFTDVRIISKPSLRFYANVAKLQSQEKRGIGRIIVSTNNGLMTGKEALKKGLGGELLFEIW